MVEVTTVGLFGVSDFVLSGFLRLVTNSRAFPSPSSLQNALTYANAMRAHPYAVAGHPGARHWQIFTQLCSAIDARGNLVPDAYLAALAMEHHLEFASSDTDFARFPALRWINPLA